MNRTGTLTHRGKTYFVEAIEGRGDEVLPVRFILRGPRGGSYGLIPTADDPGRFFAVSAKGFLRPPPFDDVVFGLENGMLVIVDPDA